GLSTTVLGTTIALPFILAPVGSSRMFWPRGEEVAAKVAGAAGTIYSLSTLSGCRLEDVRKATPGTAWFQLYLCGGRDVASATIQRAKDVGYSALILTIEPAGPGSAGAASGTVRRGCSPGPGGWCPTPGRSSAGRGGWAG